MDVSHQPSLETSPERDRQQLLDRKTFFPVTVVGITVVLTLFVYVAALFGDAKHPVILNPQTLIQQSILTHGIPVILVETALLVFVSIRAMAQDRRMTLERMKKQDDPS